MLEAEILQERRGLVKFAARARVGDMVACEAELLCTMRTIE
jgi:3-hydroxyacyl-[acyl-carrier-protein] dehydratase